MRLSALSSLHAFKPTHYQPKLTQQVNHTQRYGETTPDDKDKLVFKPPTWEERVEGMVNYVGSTTPNYSGKEADLANIAEFITGDSKDTFRKMVEMTKEGDNPVDKAIHEAAKLLVSGEVDTKEYPGGPRAWLAQHKRQEAEKKEAEKENLRVARLKAQVAKDPNGAQKWLLANVDTDGNVIPQDRKNANHKWLEERKNRNQ
jgi:hypothetical protein